MYDFEIDPFQYDDKKSMFVSIRKLLQEFNSKWKDILENQQF